MLRTVALASLSFLAGCYPTLAHPTRVDHSFRIGMALSVSGVSDSSYGSPNAKLTAVPAMDFEASLGVRDTSAGSAGPGLRLAAAVGVSGYGGSAYVELPRAWAGDVDGGVGIQLHRGAVDVVMPYVQLGALRGTEASWFLRNGVAWVAAKDSTGRKLLWLPTVGWYRHRRGGVDGGMYLTAILGHQPLAKRGCILLECLAEGDAFTRTFLIVGMTVSLPFLTAAVWR